MTILVLLVLLVSANAQMKVVEITGGGIVIDFPDGVAELTPPSPHRGPVPNLVGFVPPAVYSQQIEACEPPSVKPLPDDIKKQLEAFKSDPVNQVAYEHFLRQFGVEKGQKVLRDWQREMLTNSIALNAANMAFLDYDNELWTAEMDLELDKLEQDCLGQEKDLATQRNLATRLYLAGGPLEFFPDPPCHHLTGLDCAKLPVCARRWDCRCAKQDTDRIPYPKSKMELQTELDYTHQLNQYIKLKVKTHCTSCVLCKEGVECHQDPAELERAKQEFDREWVQSHPTSAAF